MKTLHWSKLLGWPEGKLTYMEQGYKFIILN